MLPACLPACLLMCALPPACCLRAVWARCVLPSCLPGVRYGPPGSRRMVYFVDDMNMPFVDKYDTQSAIELLRQMIDYHGW